MDIKIQNADDHFFDTLKQQKDRDEDSSDDFFEDHHTSKEISQLLTIFGKTTA